MGLAILLGVFGGCVVLGVPVAFAMGAVAGYHAATTMPSSSEVKSAGEKILNTGRDIANECGRTIKDAHLGQGDPAKEIIAYVDRCGADLIVTGRRGLGSIGSLIQGRTTQRVHHLAKCACLSVV